MIGSPIPMFGAGASPIRVASTTTRGFGGHQWRLKPPLR